ncbi:MAG: hypothetical protein L6R36_005644 [Xanthoria steineri]|nr:MAG: hypothetical protein L6R36_005644 [Xanthoria steineri]
MNANAGGMTVPNPYYPYVVLPTTYPNAEACSSAFSSCRSEFTKCTNSLTASGNGVTVSGALGGITAQPALNAASAGAVCSSLSTVACYNLGLGNCPMYGTAAATGGTSPAGNGASVANQLRFVRVICGAAVSDLQELGDRKDFVGS